MTFIRIYQLFEYKDGVCSLARYIGQTSMSLRRRLRDHIGGARRGGRSWCASWIRLALSRGSEVRIAAIDCVETYEAANEAEKRDIAILRRCGQPLTNITDGGGNGPLTDEHRRRISDAKIGRKFSVEHRKHISEARRGRRQSVETRQAQSDKMKGIPLKRDVYVKSIGLPKTLKWRANISSSIKKAWAAGKWRNLPASRGRSTYTLDGTRITRREIADRLGLGYGVYRAMLGRLRRRSASERETRQPEQRAIRGQS